MRVCYSYYSYYYYWQAGGSAVGLRAWFRVRVRVRVRVSRRDEGLDRRRSIVLYQNYVTH